MSITFTECTKNHVILICILRKCAILANFDLTMRNLINPNADPGLNMATHSFNSEKNIAIYTCRIKSDQDCMKISIYNQLKFKYLVIGVPSLHWADVKGTYSWPVHDWQPAGVKPLHKLRLERKSLTLQRQDRDK